MAENILPSKIIHPQYMKSDIPVSSTNDQVGLVMT